jgi:phosphate-selective porin OprO/OprP
MSGKTILISGAAVLLALGAAQPQTSLAAHEHKRPHKTVANAKVAAAATETSGRASTPAAAPSRPDANPNLEQRVRRLEEQLDTQQEKEAAEHTRLTTLEQSFGDTQWSLDNARPTVKSGDGRFSLAIRVRFQFDDVNYFQDSDVNTVTPTRNVQFKDLSSGALVRRAFFGVEGKAFNDFWYELRYNAGGGGSAETDPRLSLARVAYFGVPNFELNVGVIEPAFMYEGTMSSGQLPFLERPEIDNIAADSFGGGDSRKGIEARYQKQGAFMPDDNIILDAALTGSKTESTVGHGNGGDEQTQALAHAAYRLWSDGNSNISLSGDYAHAFTGGCAACAPGAVNPINLQDRPQFREDGDRLVSTGSLNANTANMWAISGGMNFANFYAGGEYARFTVDRLPVLSGGVVAFRGDNPEFSGWYIEGSWVITGEPKTYTVSATNNEVGGFGAPKVVSPFSRSGDSWGACELTARYSNTDLNWNETRIADPLTLTQAGIAGGEERIIMLGLNWYLNNNVKLQLNDGITHVSKIAAPGSNVQVGQDLNVLGVRLQFTN